VEDVVDVVVEEEVVWGGSEVVVTELIGWVEGPLGLVEGVGVVALEGLLALGSSCPGNTALPSLPPEMPRLFLIILLCWRT